MPVATVQAVGDSYLQANGKRYVTETFSLTYGEPLIHTYLAPGQWGQAEWDSAAAARVPKVNERLARTEYEELLADDAPASVALHHQTATEFIDRARAQYRNTRGLGCARIAWWLGERILSGQITQAQLRAAFGMDSAQWATFRDTKLLPLRDAYAASREAEGE